MYDNTTFLENSRIEMFIHVAGICFNLNWEKYEFLISIHEGAHGERVSLCVCCRARYKGGWWGQAGG